MRPEDAKRLLTDVDFVELQKLMQDELIIDWLQTQTDESEKREQLYQQIQLVPVLTKALTKLANQLRS